MLASRGIRFLFMCAFVVLFGIEAHCQNSLQGLNFQGLVLNSHGGVVGNKNIDVKVNIYFDSLKTTLAYGEKHASTTNVFGLFTLIVGQGIYSGGLASNFNSVNWSLGNYFLNVLIDTTGTSSYIDIGITKLVSVPYALFSSKTSKLNAYCLNQLLDADTSGIKPLAVLKWNSSLWVPLKDNFKDTVLYAYSLNHVVHADTALFALNSSPSTAVYAWNSDSALYSYNSFFSSLTSHSVYSDTATYAISASPAWSILGNSSIGASNFLGLGDNKDVVFKTNNLSRIFVSSTGVVGINNLSPQALLHIISNDAFIDQGTFGSLGTTAPVGFGTRMIWNSSKSAFRAGSVNSNFWNVDSLGIYSFVCGYNNKASGINTDGGNFSLAFGSNNTVAAGSSIAMGANNSIFQNNTAYYGSNLAFGYGNVLKYKREVVLGQSNTVTGGSCATIGSNNINGGNINAVIGSNCNAMGNGAVVIGSFANSNTKNGSFLFSDASSTTYTNSLVNNDFIVRASGGIVFFTDPDTTMGVYLASGSGSWSSISNRNKKENFLPVDDDVTLSKISQLKIKKWKYNTEKTAWHLGLIAQDMYEKFQLGESPESITMTDMDGVILSCIKALYKNVNVVSEKYNELSNISAESESLAKDFAELDKRLILIEKKSTQK
jgi:hypothetical protein